MFWPHVAKTIRLYILTLFWSLIAVIVISRIEKESYSSSEFVSLVFHPQKHTSHFWFLFSLVSLYLLLPVVKIVYDYDDVRPLFWLLFLLFLFSFGNELGNWSLNILTHSAGYWSDIADGSIKEHHLFDVEGVNPFGGNFWAWVYFICGGLIGKYLEKEHIRIPLWGLYLTFVISILALFGYGTLASEWMNGRTFDTVANAYTSVPVLAMTLSVFRILCHLPRVDGKAGSFISSIGASTLGIYLLHVPIIVLLNPYYHALSFSNLIAPTMGYALAVLFVSWLFATCLKGLPGVSYLVRL